jgi:diadenosine tetraphosphate (Ap4A) HIT family hydrolase
MQQRFCPFCDRSRLTLLAENGLAFAIRDRSPVKPLHSLILPKRHVVDIFDTSRDEREALHELAEWLRRQIQVEDPSVGGFNFGSNVGEAAGQKVFHAHLHLIPRREGDIPPPPARPRRPSGGC